MATRSFWVTKANEDHLDHYAKEWQQFFALDENGQHCLEYICFQRAKVVDYTEAPAIYLPYPVVVAMLHRFEKGSFWFHDKIVPVDANLVSQIIGLPSMKVATGHVYAWAP
eukprot:Gb_26100 [translate_table: standard]